MSEIPRTGSSGSSDRRSLQANPLARAPNDSRRRRNDSMAGGVEWTRRRVTGRRAETGVPLPEGTRPAAERTRPAAERTRPAAERIRTIAEPVRVAAEPTGTAPEATCTIAEPR